MGAGNGEFDIVHEVASAENDRGAVKLQIADVKNASQHNANLWLTYRSCTKRWLVIWTDVENKFPLGCTAAYDSDPAVFVKAVTTGMPTAGKIHIRKPSWSPILSAVEIQEAYGKA